MKSDSGFSLLELMVALLVAGILFAIGIPNMVNLVRNNRLISQANDFLAVLGTARGEAIKRGVPVVVCTSSEGGACVEGTGWNKGWTLYADLNRNSLKDATDPVILTRGELPGATTLIGNNNVANRVIFQPQGVVGAGGIGSFVLADSRGAPDGVRLVCLAMTGRARIFNDGRTECPPGG